MTKELEELFQFLRFPSVSTDSRHAPDVRNCANFLVEKLSELNLETTLNETPGHPIVTARSSHDPSKKTVLIYGHYDVQPVDPIELWDSPPFEPEIREGKIWCRGATDNKGQMYAHILGVEQLINSSDELPVNVIFVFEGEEEVGSTHLGDFLETNKADFACDVIAVSDTGMVAPGMPTLGYGLRGITACEITVKGPKSDLHSGVYGGAVANPATAIAQLIATLHDQKGVIQVEGFYDEVRPLEDWERQMWRTVPGMSEADLKEVTGSPETFGEEGYTPAECLWARPTAEINGVWGGYQGEGSKTVLPAEAHAKITCRLVPDQDPDVIFEKLKAHLEANCPAGVTLEIEKGHGGKPYAADPHSDFGKAAQEALRQAFGKEPVLIREGGSIPIIQSFKEILGADTLLLGLALPDCQIHAPNENFPVENFEAGIKMSAELLRQIAKV